MFTNQTKAQQNHFIYIQTQNEQAFYVKLNGTILSSSINGYLIIPKLKNGEYNLSIGFPKSQLPTQNISCIVDNNDAGYILKNIDDKSWVFLNILTQEVTPLGDNANVVTSKTSSTIVKNELPKIPIKKAEKETYISTISKISTSRSYTGLQAKYIDTNNGNVDTINVFISEEDLLTKKPIKKAVPINDLKFLPIELPNPNSNTSPTKTSQATTIVVVENKPNSTNNSTISELPKSNINKPDVCKSIASDNDFIKVRKAMILQENDDDMITIARKTFKQKCFTTAQIKNLGAILLTDEGKYKLYDAAYAYTSDIQNFESLQSQLTSPYYINRFKAILAQ